MSFNPDLWKRRNTLITDDEVPTDAFCSAIAGANNIQATRDAVAAVQVAPLQDLADEAGLNLFDPLT